MAFKKKTTSERKKSGPLSHTEKKNIEDWLDTLDAVDIAQRLNRPLKIVENYKQEFLAKAPRIIAKRSETEEYKRELHSSGDWPIIKQQFTHLELTFYENKYIEYRRFFKELTAMEMSQLHQLLTLDVFMQRHNIERKNNQDNIDAWSKEAERFYKRDYTNLDNDEKTRLAQLETMLAAAKATNKDKTTEYKSYLDKHNDILKSLKGTRDQRIKNNQDQGKFIALLYELEVNDRRQEMSIDNALHEMAKQKELERLSQPHVFGDGVADQPILSWETNKADYD